MTQRYRLDWEAAPVEQKLLIFCKAEPTPWEAVIFAVMYCRTFKEFRQESQRHQLPVAFAASAADIDIHLSDTLEGVVEDDWNVLVGDDTVFLHSRYFKALGPLGDALEYRYAWFTRGAELVGVAAFQITNAETTDAASNLESGNWLSRLANKILRNRQLSFRVLVLGNSFATGEHGFRFTSDVEEEQQIVLLNQAIDHIRESEKRKGVRLSATVVKDFYPESFRASDRFSDYNFAEFFVDPNMIMPVKPTWETFDDYLQALTSKYRTKAKAAFKRSADLEIRELAIEDLDALNDDLHRLYAQVYDRADFKLGKLEASCFFNLKRHLQECFSLKGYFLEGKLVGFQSSFVYDGWLDAHFVGIDYDKNYRYAIYQRMLYEYIRLGIERKVERISFGRTAMEIKSTVGAFPVDLKCYIRHRKKAPNALLKLLFGYVKPSSYNQRVAFKERELEDLEV